MRQPIRPAVLLIGALLGTVSSASAWAQGLPDPTRPGSAVDQPATMTSGEATGTGLQTIIRRIGAKPAAVINGEYVQLGGRIGDARLVKVSEDSVVLQTPTGREELKLLPSVEKKMSAVPMKKMTGSSPARDRGEAAR